ncbi:hypothetical protein [Cellulophaga sp. HaHa_2_1]|uniref:hypothetical protein n=1 Tax=Cellulophaga sp. HaHa_2_1 TaxID=2749994 RepID=UPI001C4EFEB0|nr:hypothetical protein [Cellulophaga sp. HaHa_2_1]QXP53205.1 hypothetical protein H0I24_04520 [Cellulophaga sp. HaHa_2_1]
MARVDGSVNDGSGKRTISINPIDKTGFNSTFWLMKPKNYTPTGDAKTLPKLTTNGKELGYDDTH